MKRIALIETGLANTASVRAAMGRLGVSLDSARNGDDVADADGVILPGVGSFGAAMEAIERQGLSQSLRTRIESRLPTLTICLGLQVLARKRETPGSQASGSSTPSRAVSDSLVTPQLGWNRVRPTAEEGLVGEVCLLRQLLLHSRSPPGLNRGNHELR